jgi:hypothetical protein
VPIGDQFYSGNKAKIEDARDSIEKALEVVNKRIRSRTTGQVDENNDDPIAFITETGPPSSDVEVGPPSTKPTVSRDTGGHQTFDTNLNSTGVLKTGATGKDRYLDLAEEFGIEGGGPLTVALGNASVATETLAKIVTTSPDGTYRSHDRDHLRAAQNQLVAARQMFDKVGPRRRFKKKKVKAKVQSQLITHILRPDVFMVPPPKCNVFFPDRYTHLTYSRSWPNEITRLWLHGKSEWGTDLKKMYFAPNTDMLVGPTAKDAARAALSGQGFLLKHELFSGVIPSIEGIGDVALFDKWNKSVEKRSGGTQTGPTKHMQMASKYLFFKYRVAPRTIHIQGPFNPNVVPGYPGLVIDPELSRTQIEADEPLRGKHYVGLVESISHQFSQTGARTMVVMTHCRPYDEALDEFGDEGRVNIMQREPRFDPRGKKKVKPPSDPGYWAMEFHGLDPFGKPVIGAFGTSTRSGPLITDAMLYQDPTIPLHNRYYAVPRYKTIKAPTFADPDREISVPDSEKVPALATKPALFPDLIRSQHWMVGNNTIDPNAVAFNRTRITDPQVSGNPNPERLTSPVIIGAEQGEYLEGIKVDIYQVGTTRSVQTKVGIPFEVVSRPDWLSSVYFNSNIGEKVYQELLGCGSITDTDTAGFFIPDGVLPDGSKVVNFKEDEDGNTQVVYETVRKDSDLGELTTFGTATIPKKAISGASVYEAAREIAKFYGQAALDPDRVGFFVDRFTQRAFATMEDIFGNEGEFVLELEETPRPEVKIPLQGFHTDAFGPLTELERLDHEPLLKAGGFGRERRVSPDVDPRSVRYDTVIAYRDKILSSRGQRG